MTASSCDVNELSNFRPVLSNRSYTMRCVSISDCKSCLPKGVGEVRTDDIYTNEERRLGKVGNNV